MKMVCEVHLSCIDEKCPSPSERLCCLLVLQYVPHIRPIESNDKHTVLHNINLKTCGTALRSISVFTSHFKPVFKSNTVYQKLLFHVAAAAVDGQGSGSTKMISNFSGSAEMRGALI